MIFSSLIFIFLFLPIVASVYLLLYRKFGNIVLLLGSILFYLWAEKQYVLVLFTLIILNYVLVNRLPRSRLQVILILCINLGALIFFKYLHFFFGALIGNTALPMTNHLLLGISFFVFHAISYCLDIYWGRAKPTQSFTDFSLYMMFFPQLIAGPIMKYRDMASQLKKRIFRIDWAYEGVKRFIYGLAKKVLLANTLALAADKVFSLSPTHLSFELAWLGIICFTFQIYFDFSAYSDMAIGLARIFGFQFSENFNYPYISRSIQEFWSRWHISLSHWFRDYLFIPLGGSRKGKIHTYINIFIVFTLCGFWHGANWTFLLWGGYYAFFLIIEHSPIGKGLQSLPKMFQHIMTIIIVVFGWVIFRSTDIHQIGYYTSALIGQGSKVTPLYPITRLLGNDLMLAILFAIIFSIPTYPYIKTYMLRSKNMALVSKYGEMFLLFGTFFLSILFLINNANKPFIYFRF